MFGDVDGVVVIPHGCPAEAFKRALDKVDGEDRTREELPQGALLAEVFKKVRRPLRRTPEGQCGNPGAIMSELVTMLGYPSGTRVVIPHVDDVGVGHRAPIAPSSISPGAASSPPAR